jgi:lactate dehydrogenase-like 2-hydroxyacid dehydrogenase
MSRKVLIYSRFPKALMRRIGERFELLDTAGNPPNQVFAAPELADIEALITAGGTPLHDETMDQMPKLRAIVCYGTGYDGVDLAAASRRKIALGHSPGANASSVADLAVTLMLAATRRLLVADDYVRSGASRGSVIDQDALVKALADNVIAGAGLDVYAREPHTPDALTAMANVVLTPHVGGHTIEAHVSMQDSVIANLEAFFAGRPMPYQVRLS